jgi:hypothetical protein
MAAGSAPKPGSTQTAGPQPAGGFVVNLCSSTTPMALPHPDSPELKRFSFFVSRRLEDNRERFRLHMGYFASLAEAEEWLAVVRDIYPGAWAGEAPGKRLRERAAALAAESAVAAPAPAPVRHASAPVRQPAAPVVATANRIAAQVRQPIAAPPSQARVAPPVAQQARPAAPAPVPQAVATSRVTQANAPRPVAARLAAALATPARAPVPRASAAMNVPTVHAAPAARAPQVAVPQRTAAPVARPPIAAARPQVSVQAPPMPARPPQAPAQRVAPRVTAPPQARPAATAPAAKTLSSHSNVREVMASLDETGETRMMAVPASLKQQGGVDPSSLSDTQVLKILEHRRTERTEGASDEANIGISLLKPDDTGTRRALKEAVRENAPVAFAVQLQWSVQPVELDKVAPLAIFSAYTLYTVEGSREGRKWYGLRLGFFSDAISAKQVAHYVRSEFTSVAVVPVSPQERARATDDNGKAAAAALPRRTHEQSRVEEFKLFDDTPAPAAPPVRPTAAPFASAPKAAAKALGKRKSGGGKVRAKERRSEKTLEETLEILGASELEMDNGRGELLNDTGVRHLRVEVQKETPFSRLLERLSERTRRS